MLDWLHKTVWGHGRGLRDDWRLFFGVYVVDVLWSVKVYARVERALVLLFRIWLISWCEVYLFFGNLGFWLLLVAYRHYSHLDVVRKVPPVMWLVLNTEAIGSLAISQRNSFGILSRLVERSIFGDEAQFVWFDWSLLWEVGRVPGMSDFLDGLILINLILVWNGKILAKRDH